MAILATRSGHFLRLWKNGGEGGFFWTLGNYACIGAIIASKGQLNCKYNGKGTPLPFRKNKDEKAENTPISNNLSISKRELMTPVGCRNKQLKRGRREN